MKRKTDDREPMRLFVNIGAGEQIYAASLSADYAANSHLAYGGRLIEFIEVRHPPARDTAWGDGQHDYVTLGPGVQASLRITKDGRVKLCIPGGELDVTDGGTTLGLGLCEAGKRAAQIRERRLGNARRRKAKPLCSRCGQSLFGYEPGREPLCPEREAGSVQLCTPEAA